MLASAYGLTDLITFFVVISSAKYIYKGEFRHFYKKELYDKIIKHLIVLKILSICHLSYHMEFFKI